jgi:prepilin-type N-terminal cleavage/methylation domain-containing protein
VSSVLQRISSLVHTAPSGATGDSAGRQSWASGTAPFVAVRPLASDFRRRGQIVAETFPRSYGDHRTRRSAFTLAELLVALTLMALLTAAIVSSTHALITTRTRVDEHLAASTAARQGLEAVVAALRNVRRDPDKDHPPIIGTSSGPGNSRIELQVISDTRARADGPESDQYELGFSLWQQQTDGVPVLLCRRKNALTDKPGAGGMATVAAEGIIALSFEYYSQQRWQNDWTEAELGIPEAVRVTITAAGVTGRPSNGKRSPVTLSTIVPIYAQPPIDAVQSGQKGESTQSRQNQPSESARSSPSGQGGTSSSGGSR